MKVFGKAITPSLIKDNLSLIILVPAILGGLWQLLELAALGTPYIRFFSVTQIIPDGLLVLFILGIIFLVTWGTAGLIKLSEKEDKKNEDTPKKRGIFSYIAAIIIVSAATVLFVFIFLDLLEDLTESRKKSFGTLISAILVGTLILGCICSLISVILEAFKRTINFEHPFIQTAFIQTAAGVIGLVVLIGFLVLCSGLFRAFHNSFLLPENFRNIESIRCKLIRLNKIPAFFEKGASSEDFTQKSFELLYFNDKYLFIKFSESGLGSNSDSYIEVLKFDDLMNDEACN